MKKLSADEQAYCIKRVLFWQSLWGVAGWEIAVIFGKCEGNSRAETSFNFGGRIATVLFSLNFDTNWTQEELDKTALHEVLEVFFSTGRRIIADDLYDEIVHEWIRTIENEIYPLLKEVSIENH